MVDELVTLGQYGDAETRLAAVQKDHPTDWRLAWYRGRALLAQGKMQDTLATFESIVSELPGELAPKQALGRAYEASGSLDQAISYYDAVSKADGTFTSAALGLARCLEVRKDKAGAAAAYRRVPATSSRYPQAQMALARLLLHVGTVSRDDVLAAAAAVEALEGVTDGIELHRLRAEVFSVAVRRATLPGYKQGSDPGAAESVLGVPLVASRLRFAAEKELRTCARMAPTEDERFALVDQANAIRPLTIL
jgi:serine/threonine-protein kinase PknG